MAHDLVGQNVTAGAITTLIKWKKRHQRKMKFHSWVCHLGTFCTLTSCIYFYSKTHVVPFIIPRSQTFDMCARLKRPKTFRSMCTTTFLMCLAKRERRRRSKPNFQSVSLILASSIQNQKQYFSSRCD